jgi:limonene 1,2-monooxygenase
VWQDEAAAHGHVADRRAWRMMGPMHLADTVEEAKANCRYGLEWILDYLRHIIPSEPPTATDYDGLVDELNASGRFIIGTPAMAIAQIERLIDMSGGFGAFLMMGADFAPWPATLRHYELFAEEVMPHFTGQLAPVQASYDHVMAGGDRYVAATLDAQMASIARYAAERSGGTA